MADDATAKEVLDWLREHGYLKGREKLSHAYFTFGLDDYWADEVEPHLNDL